MMTLRFEIWYSPLAISWFSRFLFAIFLRDGCIFFSLDLQTAQDNIDLQTTILSRFDLIFIVKDIRKYSQDKVSKQRNNSFRNFM